MSHPTMSVVVPCYNEEESLPLLADSLIQVTQEMMDRWEGFSLELVLVDDGSKDDTLGQMKAIAKRRDLPFSVHWISFSRNFGKEAGLYAGLSTARGDYVATMDADMQDPPTLLPKMYSILLEGGGNGILWQLAA